MHHYLRHLKSSSFQLLNVNIFSGNLLDATQAYLILFIFRNNCMRLSWQVSDNHYQHFRARRDGSLPHQYVSSQTATYLHSPPRPAASIPFTLLSSGNQSCQDIYLDQRCCLSSFLKWTVMEELRNLKEERKRGKAVQARNTQQSDCTVVELKKALIGLNSRLFCTQLKYMLLEKHNILVLGFSGVLVIQAQWISNPGLQVLVKSFTSVLVKLVSCNPSQRQLLQVDDFS